MVIMLFYSEHAESFCMFAFTHLEPKEIKESCSEGLYCITLSCCLSVGLYLELQYLKNCALLNIAFLYVDKLLGCFCSVLWVITYLNCEDQMCIEINPVCVRIHPATIISRADFEISNKVAL